MTTLNDFRPKPHRIFLVKCPKCGFEQKIIIYSGNPTGHRKKCIRCEKSFNIHKDIRSSCIIKEVKE